LERLAVPRKPEVLHAGCAERGGTVHWVPTRDRLDSVLGSRRTARRTLVALVALALAAGVVAIVSIGAPAGAAVSPGVTERVSVADNGAQATLSSFDPSVSSDGRYVAFDTNAPLDPLDARNDGSFGDSDIYVRDTVTHHTTLISVGQAFADTPGPGIVEVPSNGANFNPSISADGRYIAFSTQATNVPVNSTNANRTVICDRDASGDGILGDCTYTKVGAPGEFVENAVLDANATRLAFIQGFQTVKYLNLTKGPTGAIAATTDAEFHTPTLPASVNNNGAQFNLGFAQDVAISGDGRFLAIVEDYRLATSDTGFPRLRVLFIYDVVAGTATRLDLGENGAPLSPLFGPTSFDVQGVESVAISGDGRRVAFDYSQTNAPDPLVYVVDRDPNGNGVFGPANGEPVTSTIVSRDKTGKTVSGVAPALSADGRYVAFDTDAANVHNGVDDTFRPDSCAHPGGDSEVLPSPGTNTGISYCDVVVRDLVVDAARAAANLPRLPAELASPSIQTTCLAFVPGATCEGHGDSNGPELTADGSAAVYPSAADDLVPGDTNNTTDIFLRRFTPGPSVPSVDFGSVPVGDETILPVLVTTNGFGPLRLAGVSISGANASEFTVFPSENCTGAVLHETETCTVSVRFRPAAQGTRTAVLTVTPAGGKPASGELTGTGGSRAQPKLVASPPLGRSGSVSQVSGTGWPPNKVVVVTLLNTPIRVTATASSAGTFTVPLVIFPHTPLGKKQLQGQVQSAPQITATIDYLVVPGSLLPPDFGERR
jgi:hypothetical protein